MASEHVLPAGGHALVSLVEGAELFCSSGVLLLAPCGARLAEGLEMMPRSLPAGQAWRACQPMLVAISTGRQARYTLACRPEVNYAWAARSFIENCWSWAMPLSSARRHHA